MQELLCLVLKPYSNSGVAVNVVKQGNTILKTSIMCRNISRKTYEKEADNVQIFMVGSVISSLGKQEE